MAKKTIFIAFARGGLLPAAVTGEKVDIKVPAHTPVAVSADYGQHLIDDKFAYDATDLAEALNSKAKADRKAKADAEAAEAAAAQTVADIAAAQKAVDAANAKLAAATDDDAKAAAEDELKAAEDALAAVKA